MTKYLGAIGFVICVGILTSWPRALRADEEYDRKVEQHDDGYEVNEKWTDDDGHQKKVHVDEHVETDDDGNVIHHRERRVEHEHDDDD
jgi:hypothetical protein